MSASASSASAPNGAVGPRSMNRRLVVVASAGASLAGVGTVVVPQHAVSIVRLMAATVAVVAGGLVLAAVAPHVSATTPETALDRTARRRAHTLDPHGLRDARRDLARPSGADGLPTEVRGRLRQTAEFRLARVGVDLAAEDRARNRVALQPATWAALLARHSGTPARTTDPARAAAAVHRVLDDLDTLAPTPGEAHGHR